MQIEDRGTHMAMQTVASQSHACPEGTSAFGTSAWGRGLHDGNGVGGNLVSANLRPSPTPACTHLPPLKQAKHPT